MNNPVEVIKQLLALTVENGASENEAHAAKERAIKIALKYRLNINALGGRTKGKQSETIKTIRAKKDDLWIQVLGNAVARKTDTFFIEDNLWYIFFGTREDGQAARKLFNPLYQRVHKFCLCKKPQYKFGVAMKVAMRLLPNNPSAITAIVAANREEQIGDFEQDKNCQLVKRPLFINPDDQDFIRGYRDGDNININVWEELDGTEASCLPE